MNLIHVNEEHAIVTKFVHPPIPIRAFDWLAYIDGQEEGLQGWGYDEAMAIEDLKEKLSELKP